MCAMRWEKKTDSAIMYPLAKVIHQSYIFFKMPSMLYSNKCIFKMYEFTKSGNILSQ